MKANTLFLAFSCFTLLIFNSLSAQAFFEKEFDPGFSLDKLIENPDGSITAVGLGQNLDRMSLLKISPTGDSLWTQSFTTSTQYKFMDAIRAQNGDYLLLAEKLDPLQTLDKQTVVRCDNNGNLLYLSEIQSPVNRYDPKNIFELSDGTVAVWGNIDTSATGMDYPYFLTLDSLGGFQNQWEYRSWKPMIGATYMSDGGFALHAQHQVSIPQGQMIGLPLIYRVNSQLSPTWTWASTDTLPTYVSHITESPDGGLYLAGSNHKTYLPVPEPGSIAQVTKLDSIGNLIWLHRHHVSAWEGENSHASRVRNNGTGGYTFMGSTQSYQSINNSMVLASADSSGQLIWDREFRVGNTFSKDMIRMADGGYALSCDQYFSGSFATILIRTDALGVDRTAEAVSLGFQVWPNPNTGVFRVQVTEGASGTFHLYDLQGRERLKRKISPRQNLSFSIDGLPAGVYLGQFIDLHGNRSTRRIQIR